MIGRGIVGDPGDPEIEQARPPAFVDHDVRQLDVAMHDKPRMRIGNGIAQLEEEPQAIVETGLGPRAPGTDIFAVDIFHRHVGAAVFGDAAVDQPGYAGMFERGEQLAFRFERGGARDGLGAQHLQGDLLRETRLGPLGQIDLAHPAASDQPDDPERTHLRAAGERGIFRRRGGERGAGRHVERARAFFGEEQAADLIGDERFGARARKRVLPLPGPQRDQAVEKSPDRLPFAWGGPSHDGRDAR